VYSFWACSNPKASIGFETSAATHLGHRQSPFGISASGGIYDNNNFKKIEILANDFNMKKIVQARVM